MTVRRSRKRVVDRPEIVVVTGASAGVGRAVAREFARHGARVGLVARGRAGLEGAARDVEALGGKPLIAVADVARADELDAAAEYIESQLGPIDVWVNCAMTTVFGEFMQLTPEEFERVTAVTYLGFVNGTRAALRRMLLRDRGTIVQVGSALAYRSIPLQSAYCGAKHAMQGMTQSLRCELQHAQSKIWITVVQLPAVNTPQFGWCRNKLDHAAQPVPPIYQPEVAARAIYFAAHHRRREIYVGGSTAEVIVGNKWAPGLGDWYLARRGYSGQLRSEAKDPRARDNLFVPVDGEHDHGAHGGFDGQARTHSWEVAVTQHWGLVAAGVVLLGLGLVGSLWHR